MCGIYGRIDLASPRIAPCDADAAAVAAMRHRGPDDEGGWYGSRVFLGMRRLSVIDLDTGHQPIFNEDRSVCVVYNGEIYNYREMRDDLESRGHRFATNADTEVIAHGWEEWGERVVSRLNGMFAFALWDERAHTLWLVRDRLGIKPLYYLQDSKRLLFASEIKAILAHPDVPREVDDRGLLNFITYGHAVAPDTIYRGIKKLLPGHAMRVDNGRVTTRAWWDVAPGVPEEASEHEWAARVRSIVEDSVRRQMIADVPVGAFLSGGVDSSAVVALMAKNTRHRVKTFAVGFDFGREFNELKDARRVAEHIGTDHHEILVKSHQLVDAVQTLVYHFDEPFGDAACFPTYLVSRLARAHVTVALTGEGGDELFGGYRRYWADRWLRIGHPLMSAGSGILRPLADTLPRLRRLKKLVDAGRVADDAARYTVLMRVFTADLMAELVDAQFGRAVAAYDAVDVYRPHFSRAAETDHMNRLMYADVKTWLADTYLEKVDKSSMAVSLEARVPLLDHRLVELSLRMPSTVKIGAGDTKRVFKNAVKDLLPDETLRKPKHGFAVPIDPWFRGELRQFAYDVLLDARTRQRGFFRADVVERLWREHQSGREMRDGHLWVLLNFELWARRFLDVRDAVAA